LPEPAPEAATEQGSCSPVSPDRLQVLASRHAGILHEFVLRASNGALRTLMARPCGESAR